MGGGGSPESGERDVVMGVMLVVARFSLPGGSAMGLCLCMCVCGCLCKDRETAADRRTDGQRKDESRQMGGWGRDFVGGEAGVNRKDSTVSPYKNTHTHTLWFFFFMSEEEPSKIYLEG